MTPEDEQALTTHAREIAKILHRNAPQEAIQTLYPTFRSSERQKIITGQVHEGDSIADSYR